MDHLISKYNELFTVIYEKREKFPEQDLCCFVHAKGEKYNGELMIVGRAVNGWGNQFNKNSIDNNSLIVNIQNDIDSEDLKWVKDLWGPNEKYNTKKSAFWRTSKSLASVLTTGSVFETDSIVWNNLYKISKAPKGNPSSRLRDIQSNICQDLFIEEIRLCNPKIIVLLTGYGWAKPFLSKFTQLPLIGNNKFIEFVGFFENSFIVVGQHPQGKSEQDQIKEIIDICNLNDKLTVR